MKLQTVNVYSSVRFGIKDETHFDLGQQRFANLSMEFVPDMQAVKLSMPGVDTIYVFVTNCAYVRPLPEQAKAQKAK